MTEQPEFERKRPILEHIDELLVRLRRCLFWVFFGAVGAYFVSGHIVRWLEEPLMARLPAGGHLVFTAPFEKIWVYLRISVIAGVIVVFPLVGWETSAFLKPALKPIERRRILWFVLWFLLFFSIGIFLGYRYSMPLVIDAALRFGSGYEMPFLTLSTYINVCLGILLFTAIMLEIPVVMSFLSSWGWVKAQTWAKGRKMSVVVNAVVSAILSPPDAMSMIIMMVPLQLLYESGIWGARMAQWFSYGAGQNRKNQE